MKIGFDLHSLVSDTKNVTSDDTAVIRKLFAPLESSGNELFVFFPSRLDRKGSGKYKKGSSESAVWTEYHLSVLPV